MCLAQSGSYSPQAGMEGSTAIAKDSKIFRDWARMCTVERGFRQINQPDSGLASTGNANYAIGKPDAPVTVSLGDGGSAVVMFAKSMYDGEGADFAVFENGFTDAGGAFLELAFVEASSDGVNFFRFPAVSENQDTMQTLPFGNLDASHFYNLAGKYIAGYGVPFDLSELPDTNLLNKMAVSHIRIVDVVGIIDTALCSYDSKGNIINDPWPTNFAQSGFDLDAVGVIHSNIPLSTHELKPKTVSNFSIDRCFDMNGATIPCDRRPAGLSFEVDSQNNSIRKRLTIEF
ncbi:MAG: hypothetical protein Salg2KO_13320 [Salibacteraceae bacterium]